MAPKSLGGNRKLSTRERSELFVSRRNKAQVFQFGDLDPALLVAALNTAIRNETTLSFAPAQGGIGVTLRVYRGDYGDTEFAGSPLELAELLTLLVEGLSSDSEDVVQVTEMYLAQKRQTKVPK